jgi:hypothetical protein
VRGVRRVHSHSAQLSLAETLRPKEADSRDNARQRGRRARPRRAERSHFQRPLAPLHQLAEQLDARAGAGLAQQVFLVKLHGAGANRQVPRDVLGGVPQA